MESPTVLYLMLGSFALLGTIHLLLAARLMLRAGPWYRGLLALFVVPLTPYFAYREGWRGGVAAWTAAVACYAVFRAMAAAY
jgi:hypothetical protein